MKDNKRDILKDYNNYWNNIKVDNELHGKILKSCNTGKKNIKLKYRLAAGCTSILVLAGCIGIFWMSNTNMNNNNINIDKATDMDISQDIDCETEICTSIDLPDDSKKLSNNDTEEMEEYASLQEFLERNPDLFEEDYKKWISNNSEVSTEVSVSHKIGDKAALSEIKKNEIFGKYFPDSIKGFVAEEGVLGEEYALLSYTKAYDYITIKAEKINEYNKTNVVDINKPETYDLSLYTIPLADSVPEKYRETVENPIFRAEDITEELLKKRMYTISDSNDTDGIRINFGVMYEGTIVSYNIKGISSLDGVLELLK